MNTEESVSRFLLNGYAVNTHDDHFTIEYAMVERWTFWKTYHRVQASVIYQSGER